MKHSLVSFIVESVRKAGRRGRPAAMRQKGQRDGNG